MIDLKAILDSVMTQGNISFPRFINMFMYIIFLKKEHAHEPV